MHYQTLDVPCKFCSASPKEHCRTRMGRRYYRLHVKRQELAGYVNDGTLAKLMRKAR
jgi:hypothetical protein